MALYTKNAYGVFRAQTTSPVVANVVLPTGANNALPNLLEGPLRGEGKRERGKKGREKERKERDRVKHTLRNRFISGYGLVHLSLIPSDRNIYVTSMIQLRFQTA